MRLVATIALAGVLACLPLATPVQAREHHQSCAPLWITNGKCRTDAWTCRHYKVPRLICNLTLQHARYEWCLRVDPDTGETRKCRRLFWRWHGYGGAPIRTGF